jgi:hypothetical protein
MAAQMKAIWMHGRATCRSPQDLAGPCITIHKAWLYHAALAAKELLPLYGGQEIETASGGNNLIIQENKQVRSPPGGAVCAYLPM